LFPSHDRTGEELYSNASQAYIDAYGDLVQIPELDIDTSMTDSAYSDAKRYADRQFSRAYGQEQAEDAARQSTADSLGRAIRSGGSMADIMGFLGESEARERAAINNINIQAIQEREGRISSGLARLESAASRRADFYQQKEMAEFQDDLSRGLRMSDFRRTTGLSLAEIENQNAMNLISARDSIASSNAAYENMRAGNTESFMSGLGNLAMNYGMMRDNRDFLTNLLP